MSHLTRTASSLLLIACATGCLTEGPVTSDPPGDTAAGARTQAPILQPLSAQAGLRDVLLVLDETRSEESWIEPRRIAATTREDHVDVRLDLLIHAPDDIVASRLYGRLIDELETAAWSLEVKRSATEPLPDGRGLVVDEVRVSVAREPQLRSSSDGGTIEALIREVSVRSEIALGPLEVSPRSGQPDPETLDRRWRIRPMKRTGWDMQTLLSFASQLEEAGAERGVVVTSIELDPLVRSRPTTTLSSWTYELETTIRERAL